MTDKQIVLRKYPDAGAQYLKAVSDADGIHGKDHWRIHDGGEHFAETIGVGETEEAAWMDAAKKAKKRSGDMAQADSR